MFKNTYVTKYGKMTCFKNDIVFNECLKKGKIFEEELILNNIIDLLNNNDNNKILLDIGSHIGSHSIIYSKLIKNSYIYAFEPQKEIFNLLEQNVKDNNLTNIKLFNNAVGHKTIKTTLSKNLYDGYNCNIEYNTNKSFNYGGIGLGEKGEQVEMITIDELNLDKCDYIKLDIEGAEILALIGGIETIKKFKPIIFFEKTDKIVSQEMINSLNINFEIQDTTFFLSNLGYKYKYIDNNNILAIYEN